MRHGETARIDVEEDEKSEIGWIDRLQSIAAPMVVLLVFSTFLTWFVRPSPPFKDCFHKEKENHQYNALHHNHSVFVGGDLRVRLTVYCSAAFVRREHEGVEAFATVLVAMFTFTLWWSTEKLWRADRARQRETNKLLKANQIMADAARRSADAAVAAELPILNVIPSRFIATATRVGGMQPYGGFASTDPFQEKISFYSTLMLQTMVDATPSQEA